MTRPSARRAASNPPPAPNASRSAPAPAPSDGPTAWLAAIDGVDATLRRRAADLSHEARRLAELEAQMRALREQLGASLVGLEAEARARHGSEAVERAKASAGARAAHAHRRHASRSTRARRDACAQALAVLEHGAPLDDARLLDEAAHAEREQALQWLVAWWQICARPALRRSAAATKPRRG